jgi:hypothetical protein
MKVDYLKMARENAIPFLEVRALLLGEGPEQVLSEIDSISLVKSVCYDGSGSTDEIAFKILQRWNNLAKTYDDFQELATSIKARNSELCNVRSDFYLKVLENWLGVAEGFDSISKVYALAPCNSEVEKKALEKLLASANNYAQLIYFFKSLRIDSSVEDSVFSRAVVLAGPGDSLDYVYNRLLNRSSPSPELLRSVVVKWIEIADDVCVFRELYKSNFCSSLAPDLRKPILEKLAKFYVIE